MRAALFVTLVVLALVQAAFQQEKPITLPLGVHRTTLLTRIGGQPIHLDGNLTYWGEYFASVGLGTPPQYLNLQVDTASTDLICFSKSCDGCGTNYVYYDPAKSSTSAYIGCDSTSYRCSNQCLKTPANCQFLSEYGDGASIKGELVNDVLAIGSYNTQGQSVAFGAINKVDAPNGFEETGVDGIMGFAYQSISSWDGPSVFESLQQIYNFYDAFSMCLRPQGGVLQLGTNYTQHPLFKWTPIVDEEWYGIEIEDIAVGGTSVGLSWADLNRNGVIVDSGTALLVVPTTVYKSIEKIFLGMCTKVNLAGVCNVPKNQSIFHGACVPMSAEEVNKFPTLDINYYQLGSLSIRNVDYLWQGSHISGHYCLGITVMDNLPIIIGDIFMQRYHVVFDREVSQIGFAPLSTCPPINTTKPHSLESN
jgi:hypothetical protein